MFLTNGEYLDSNGKSFREHNSTRYTDRYVRTKLKQNTADKTMKTFARLVVPVLEAALLLQVPVVSATGSLERFLSRSSSGYELEFIDGSETYYNDYAQAWRLLGFYVDCNSPHNNYNECSNNNDGGGNNNNDDDNSQADCQRYLLWAAYVDPDYAGGKIGEYQFYDRHEQVWDTSSCHDGSRCAKMDCHLKSTNWELLGFFKEPNYHEWMEQLFKHQGVCLWTDEEYNFMENDRNLWPCSCTSTGVTDENGDILYYDTKPMAEARIGLGLYTDNRCRYDYTGDMDTSDVLSQAQSNGNNDYGSIADLEQSLHTWNDAFDVYKVCQPCKAYDLGYNEDAKDRQGGGGDDDDEPFTCYDDAGYVDVNQCMKFKTKTEMLAADFRDIMLAHEQGTIVEFEVMGQSYGYGGYRANAGQMKTGFTMSGKPSVPLVKIIFMVCAWFFAIFALQHLWNLRRRKIKRLTAPLVDSFGSS